MSSDILKHHGVKGMKWGVRNDRGHEGETAKTKVIAKADKKYDQSFRGLNGFIKVNNSFADKINPRLEKLNDSSKFRDVDLNKNPALKKAYYKEFEKAVDASAKEMMAEFGTNASGTKRIEVRRTGSGEDSYYDVAMVDIKHSNEDGLNHIQVFLTLDDKGKVISTKVVDPDVNHSDMSFDDFLEHYGVKGMRWGVRRESGLTVTDVSERGFSKATNIGVKDVAGKRNLKSAGGTKLKAHEDAIRAKTFQTAARNSGTKALSNKELQELVNRMNLEQQYTRLTTPQKKQGKSFVEQVLKDGPKLYKGAQAALNAMTKK